MFRGSVPEPAPELIAEISERLRDVCATFDAEEFDQLVMDIARIQVKYELRFDAGEGRAESDGAYAPGSSA